MVGISGGRDSTFILLKLVKDYRLRVLAVNYENPFASPQAKQNIEKTCAILKVDKLVWRYPKGEHQKATKKP